MGFSHCGWPNYYPKRFFDHAFKFTKKKGLIAFIVIFKHFHFKSNLYLAKRNNTTMIKYTTQFLQKIEEMIGESDYMLRYEKGNFKSGYCVLKDQKIIIVNKFYTTEGKINALLDIIKNTALDTSKFSEKNQKLYEELQQTPVANWLPHF